MLTYLDFEKPIAELETRVAELRQTASKGDIDLDPEIVKLEAKAGSCTLTITSDYTRPKKIEGNMLSESSRAGESSYNLTGTFHSDTAASGTLKMTNHGSHCNLDVDTTWEMTRQ